MNELKQKALEVAEMFEENAQFGYEMILRAEGSDSPVARQLNQYQVQFAKEHEANAQLLRDLVAALDRKPLSDEEIYDLWCDADPTEYLPEMRMKDGSINTELVSFVRLIEERHGIK